MTILGSRCGHDQSGQLDLKDAYLELVQMQQFGMRESDLTDPRFGIRVMWVSCSNIRG
jgi:hypothetical protein